MPSQPNSTLETVNDYIDDARILLQDTISPFRYDDSSLLTGLNVALLEGYRLRADLFVFNDKCPGGRVPSYFEKDNSVVPIEQGFRLAFLHGMVGHALERDQEDVQDARVMMFLNFMVNQLTGKSIIIKAGP